MFKITDSMVPWVEKYRPKTLSSLTQSEALLQLFNNCSETKQMSHFLFYGPPGTGKTSTILALGREIFKEHYKDRVLEFNASDDRGINTVRERITTEARKYVDILECSDKTTIPPYKIIILDEADAMTEEAQDALRVIIEKYSKLTRFCFICNYASKITDAIKSRCIPIYFKPIESTKVKDKIMDIAKIEKLQLDDLVIDCIVEITNGDMRKAITVLQSAKYLLDYKRFYKKPIIEMNLKELKAFEKISLICTEIPDMKIYPDDIYSITGYMSKAKIEDIIKSILEATTIINIKNICTGIISHGFSVDNIILQLNDFIMKSDLIPPLERAQIIKYSGNILAKIKQSASEYIQLLNYLTYINLTYRSI